MPARLRLIGVALLIALSATACSSAGGSTGSRLAEDPAKVVAVPGHADLRSVELTADAAQRIGLSTEAVRSDGPAALSVPLAAVIYDEHGGTWVYLETAALTFERAPVVVTRVDGDRAVLSSGPAAGKQVATVGAAELRGSEYGVPGE